MKSIAALFVLVTVSLATADDSASRARAALALAQAQAALVSQADAAALPPIDFDLSSLKAAPAEQVEEGTVQAAGSWNGAIAWVRLDTRQTSFPISVAYDYESNVTWNGSRVTSAAELLRLIGQSHPHVKLWPLTERYGLALRAEFTSAAPAVAAPAAFQRTTIERRESHNCPQCGALVLAKSGRGPEPGTHLHRCPYCNVVWFHDDK
jgi:predicted RNA-binding Zn-ribbon protein involved in translation (DUF1610 family)